MRHKHKKNRGVLFKEQVAMIAVEPDEIDFAESADAVGKVKTTARLSSSLNMMARLARTQLTTFYSRAQNDGANEDLHQTDIASERSQRNASKTSAFLERKLRAETESKRTSTTLRSIALSNSAPQQGTDI